MIRFIFRLLATAALAVAVIMAVIDATRSIAASTWVVTPLATSWSEVSPDTFEAAAEFTRDTMMPQLWDPLALAVLSLPGFVVFLLLALVLYAIGRRPQRRLSRFAIN
jgi:inosine-uridine nucleoside N-ribohydrolase